MTEYKKVRNKEYEVIKKVTYGYLLKDKKNNLIYLGEHTNQGIVYKDYDAYKNGTGICYIPEYGFEKDYSYFEAEDTEIGSYTKEGIYEEVIDMLNQDNYRNFFKKIPDKLVKEISDYLFDTVDWQHITSLAYEIDFEEDIVSYFERFPDEVNEYANKEYLQKRIKEMDELTI